METPSENPGSTAGGGGGGGGGHATNLYVENDICLHAELVLPICTFVCRKRYLLAELVTNLYVENDICLQSW